MMSYTIRRALCCNTAAAFLFALSASASGQCEVQIIQNGFNLGDRIAMSGSALALSSGIYEKLKVEVHRRDGLQYAHEATLNIPPVQAAQNAVVTLEIEGDWLIAGDGMIGSPQYNIYRHENGAWLHVQTIAIENFTWLGAAFDGDRLLLGGVPATYRLQGDEWVLEAEFAKPSESGFSTFGSAVALAGNRAVISDSWANNFNGLVHVYEFENDQWTLVKTIAPDPSAGVFDLGSQVRIVGDLIVAQASSQNRIYFFGPNDEVSWIDEADLPSTPDPIFEWGFTTNKEGTRMMISTGTPCGPGGESAHLLALDGSNWQHIAQLTISTCADFSIGGWAFALDGDFAAINDEAFGGSGTVNVFAGILGDHSCADCPADLTGSGSVGVPDLLTLLGAWGTCPNPSNCPADLTGNGAVGVPDLLEMLANWGACD